MGDSVHDHNDVYYYKGQGGWSTLDEGHTDILGCRRLSAKISISCVTQSEVSGMMAVRPSCRSGNLFAGVDRAYFLFADSLEVGGALIVGGFEGQLRRGQCCRCASPHSGLYRKSLYSTLWFIIIGNRYGWAVAVVENHSTALVVQASCTGKREATSSSKQCPRCSSLASSASRARRPRRSERAGAARACGCSWARCETRRKRNP